MHKRILHLVLLGIVISKSSVAGAELTDGVPPSDIARRLAEYPVKLQEPLRYGGDLVEVTSQNTLRRRYRVWGDWEAELRTYLDEARANAAARGRRGARVRMGCLFLKNARITFPRIPGTDGQPLTGTFTTPAGFVQAMKTRGMREYSNFMFAFSRGELEVEWVTETLEGLHWISDTDQSPSWSCQPCALGDVFLKALAKYKGAGVCMWMLCAGEPTTVNGGPKQKIQSPPYGISYTQWPIHGGYSLVLSAQTWGSWSMSSTTVTSTTWTRWKASASPCFMG